MERAWPTMIEWPVKENEEPPVGAVHHQPMRCSSRTRFDGNIQIWREIALPGVQLKTGDASAR
jgi:hypothetical protein